MKKKTMSTRKKPESKIVIDKNELDEKLDRKEIGNAIRHLRKVAGYKRRKFAKMVDMPKDQLVLVEHGGKMNKQTIKSIAKALDIPKDCLLVFGLRPQDPKSVNLVNSLKKLIVNVRRAQMKANK